METFMAFSISVGCLPSTRPSRPTSRPQENKMRSIRRKFSGREGESPLHMRETTERKKEKTPAERMAGHGLSSTRWKGCWWDIIMDGDMIYLLSIIAFLVLLGGGPRIAVFVPVLGLLSLQKKRTFLTRLLSLVFSEVSSSLLSFSKNRFYALSLFLRIFLLILFSNWMGLFPFLRHNFLRKIRSSILLIALFFWLFSYVPFFFFGKENFTRFVVGEMKFPILSFLLSNIEVLTHLFRPITLSARLWVNIWVGHLIMRSISFFSLISPLLTPLVGVGFFLFEMGIIFLQTFVFRYLAKVYFEENLEHSW